MQTVVELPEFRTRAKSLLTDAERESIVQYLAMHPEAGAIMKGKGEARAVV
jgi:hypothetical protein